MPRKPHTHHYIYKTTCKVTGKFYIGMHSTSNLNDNYIGSGKVLWYSIKKWGIENHEKEILEFLPSRKELGEREKELVNESTIADPMCMNLKKGGEYSPGTYGKKYSEESRKRMTQWERTPEMREKMSQAAKGKPKSEEHRKSISRSQKGKTESLDSKTRGPRSQEFKDKVREGTKAAMMRDEVKQKLKAPKTGSNAKGTKKSEETKMKMRKPKMKLTCPHCGLIGGGSRMRTHHFDNCNER